MGWMMFSLLDRGNNLHQHLFVLVEWNAMDSVVWKDGFDVVLLLWTLRDREMAGRPRGEYRSSGQS